MGKKLLSIYLLFSFFLLSSWSGFGQTSCVSSAPTVTITNTTASATLCKDGTTTDTAITFTSNNPSAAKSYQWQVQIGNGAWNPISGATSSTLSYTNPAIGSNRIRLVITYCNNSGTTNEDLPATSTQSGIITVYEKKEGKITISADNTNICPGENVNFTTSNPGNLGATPSYSWRVNGTQRGTGATFNRSDLKAGDNVQLFVTSTVPCVDPVESNILPFTEKAGTPATPAAFTSGETEVCPGLSKTYTVPKDNTASEYIWTLPTGWAGTSNSNSITVTTGNSGSGNITVKAKNSCGTSGAQTLAVSVKAGTPATPGPISGTAQVCPGVPQTFSVTNISGVSYTWEIPSGWNGTSTSNSITLTPTGSAQNGNLSVTAGNDCGTSPAKILAITVKPGTPVQAGVITGPADLCPGAQGTYTVPPVTGAISYIWTLPTGFSATSLTTSTPSLLVTAGNSGSGNITVKASNDCGTGPAQTMVISINPPKPVLTDNITGSTGVCASTPGLKYSIPTITNATSYEWSIPSGWTITSGSGTREITVTAGTTGGNISVIAKNGCGDSATKSITIGLNPPPPTIPGAIAFSDGTDKACVSILETYSIPAVTNATGYLWTLPNGSTRTTTTPSLSYTATTSGTQSMSVSAVNSCGTSAAKSFSINVAGGEPAQPGTITASKYTVCPPETSFTLSVPEASDADSYQWFLPAGWEITNGAGTRSITVKINASSNYSNPTVVGVEAKNNCGSSTRRNTSSNINDANAIAVSDFVFVNLGEDKILCKTTAPVDITASLNFGGKKLKIFSIKSSSGVTVNNLPKNPLDSYPFTYTPTQTDLNNGSVIITLTTENPGGACQAGKDEILLTFRPMPTASLTLPAPICAGSSTNILVTGSPGTKVTYQKGSQTGLTIDIGSSGSATIQTGNLTSSTNFRLNKIAYTDNPTCSEDLPQTNNIDVVVNQTPTARISYSTPFCTSSTTAQLVDLTKTGTTTGASFSSSTGLTIDSSSGAINPSTSTPGTYTVTYTIPASGGCEPVVVTTQVKISEKVAITSQPTGDRVCKGENVQFSVSATGEGLTYKWFKGTVGSGTAVTGGTSAVLTLNNATISNAGSYYVEVSGTSPCAKVPSQVVELVVDEDIEITTQPTNTAICVGGAATLNVAASAGNTALKYQWYKGAPGSGAALGTNSASIEIPGATLNDSGSYYVVISGPENFICNPITSQTAVLTVRDTPTVEISGTTEICDAGDTEIFFTNGTPNAIVTYTVNNGSSQTITLDASGEAILSTGSLSVTNNEITTYTYGLVSVKYPDAPDCTTNVSGSAVVTVNPTPEANVSFENDQITFCNDTTQGSFTPNLQGSGAFSNGTFSAEGLTVDPNDGSFSPANAAAGNYTLKYFLTGSGGCSDLGATLDIIIYENVKITSEPFSVAVCTANNTQLEVAATGDELRYQWFKVGATDAEVGNNSPILELNNITAANAGDYYVVISGDNACGSATSEVVTVTVDENILIAAANQPQSQNICSGDEATLRVSATASGDNSAIQYQWQFRANKQTAWSDSGASQTGDTFSEISTGQAGEYRARIDGPDGFSCDTGFSQIAKVTTYEAPTAGAGENFEVCSTLTPIAIGEGATASNQTSLIWTTTGQGQISNATDLTAATYAPVAADFGQNIEFTLTAILEVDGIQLCADAVDTKEISIIPQPELTAFSYTANLTDTTTEFCETDTQVKGPTIDGNNLSNGTGTFTVDKAELTLDPQSGEFIPNGNDPGVYIITYTFNATSNTAVCTEVSRDFTVTIGANPVATFEYGNTIYCRDTRDNTFNIAPIISFTEDGHENADSFIADNSGLVLDEATGAIDLSGSSAGTYTITRTVDYKDGAEDGCQPVTAGFTITINDRPIPDFSYASTEYCSNPETEETITPIMSTNAVKGAFNYTATPANAVLALNTVNGEINITASEEGTFIIKNTLDTEGDGCDAVIAEFTISLDKLPVAFFTYAGISGDKSFCISNFGATIDTTPDTGGTYSISGPSTLVTVNPSTGQLTWTAADGVAGSYVVTYKVPAGTVCEEVSFSESITIDSLPVGGNLSWSNNERVYLTCEVQSNNLNEVLKLENQIGEIVEWEYRTASTLTWTTYNSENSTLTSSDFVSILGSNVESTVFRAKIANGACNNGTYSRTAILSVIPSDIKPAPVEVSPDILCYGTEISLSSSTGYGESFGQFDGGDFTSAGIKNKGWNFTDPNGNEIPYDANANNGNAIHWHKTQPKWKFITADINSPYSTNPMTWNPLDDGKTNEHFAITQGTFSSNMDTPPFNLSAIDEAILTFDQAFNLTTNATIRVVLLKNGVEYKELYKITGSSSSGYYEGFGNGIPGVNQMTIDLGSYIGESNLRIRFEYTGVRAGDVWAVDNIKVPDGPQDVLLQWFYDDDPADPNNTLEQIGVDNEEKVSFIPEKIGWNDFEVKTALLLDSNGDPCEDINNSETIRVFVFDQYTTNVTAETGECGNNQVTLTASTEGAFQGPISDYPTIDGYSGSWVITGPNEDYTLTNADPDSELNPLNNPNIILEGTELGNYTISWKLTATGVYPNDFENESLRGQPIVNSSCPPEVITNEVILLACTTLDFDGTDDFVSIPDVFAEAKSFEMWIYPESSAGTIISGPGIEIKMSDLPSYVTANNRWYHLALVNNTLFVDGIDSGVTLNATGTGNQTLIGAKWNNATKIAENHFSGWIEEVRIWKKTLSADQIRFMMNQHLQNDANMGVEIPMPVPGGLSYADLDGYYRLISAEPDPLLPNSPVSYPAASMPINGNTPDLANNGIPGRLFNMTTHQQNTAPMPYISGSDGDWETVDNTSWLRPSVWDDPNSTGFNGTPIDWNIVRTKHNINSRGRNIKVLGLLSEKETLDMEGTNPTDWENGTGGSGNELFISHYLLLNGKIDLSGESQLVQPMGSILDATSSGSLQRDQQGTANSYNYNYWSSPVSGAGNAPYTVAGVLKDGTIPTNPGPISFGDPYAFADGNYAGDTRISNYWIAIFNGNANEYGEWAFQYGSAKPIQVGEGYTMKGTSGAVALSTAQNYTFVGLPNNGTILLESKVDKNYLLGNPYPSAIDANEFINDNLAVNRDGNYFDGALYFWDHFGKKDSHILLEYVGGYAALTKTGGVPAISNDERIDANLDKNDKSPGRYIPVGQGFFINSTTGNGYNISPGMIKFENDQRIFIPEAEKISQFLKPEVHVKVQKEPEIEKIRISYKSPLGYRRQILVGAHPSATNGFDLGYDAPLFDYNKEDMYWIQDDNWLVIQGVSNFDKDQVLPLGIVLEKEGEFTIKIDTLENMEDGKNIYIRDILNDTIHNLTKAPFVATSEGGYINDRFEIVFYKEVPPIKPEKPGDPTAPVPGGTPDGNELDVRHGHESRELQILNPQQVDITNLYVYDLNGKLIETYYNIKNDKVVLLPVRNFSSGVYIIKLHAENQVISKKIIISI